MEENKTTNVSADAGQSEADAQDGNKQPTSKMISDEEFKKVVAERDKAKEKARKYEEEEKKRLEQKRIEEGELKAVLAEKEKVISELSARAAAYEAQQNKLRESILSKVPTEFADFAKDIHDIDKLSAFVEKLTSKQNSQTATVNAKGQIQSDNYANIKSFDDLAAALKAQNLA